MKPDDANELKQAMREHLLAGYRSVDDSWRALANVRIESSDAIKRCGMATEWVSRDELLNKAKQFGIRIGQSFNHVFWQKFKESFTPVRDVDGNCGRIIVVGLGRHYEMLERFHATDRKLVKAVYFGHQRMGFDENAIYVFDAPPMDCLFLGSDVPHVENFEVKDNAASGECFLDFGVVPAADTPTIVPPK